MGTCNQYYSNRYDSCVPIESYGEQFRNYMDEKFKTIANDEDINNVINSVVNSEKNITDSLSNVESNLAGSLGNVESNLAQAIVNSTNKTVCCIKEAISNSEDSVICNINNAVNDGLDNAKKEIIDDLSTKIDETSKNVESNLTSAITESADNVVKATETICKNIESNLASAITESADNVVKANETTAKNVESNLTSAITKSADNVAKVVRTESSDQKAKIDKLREDLIQAINNSDSLTSAGFSDLNSAVIANKEDAVYRINRQANVNKKEILNAIGRLSFDPYIVYGGTVLNLVHNNISTIQESDILKLASIKVETYSPDIQFSIRITDVKVDGMNDDPTGEIFNEAKERNELNILFAYPSKLENVEVFDSIELNVTKQFDKKELQVNGENYIVLMQYDKIINLYDPKWETPSDYTLNYTLNIG